LKLKDFYILNDPNGQILAAGALWASENINNISCSDIAESGKDLPFFFSPSFVGVFLVCRGELPFGNFRRFLLGLIKK